MCRKVGVSKFMCGEMGVPEFISENMVSLSLYLKMPWSSYMGICKNVGVSLEIWKCNCA